jgi:glycosyltransferase involved in cell wall biosynthesis
MAPSCPELSVVVSTYNRPEVLGVTLASLRRQTYTNWQAVVLGDCCDRRTGEVVGRLDDPRIRYFNLPGRCGDQGGPNSIGAALCDSPYLAFLNHDDLLVPDHFAICLKRLEETSADICVGRRVRVSRWIEGDGDPRLQYDLAPRNLPPLAAVILPDTCDAFEPVSAWVVRADSYRRVGEWRDGLDLYRTPFNDWLLRAYVAGVRFVPSATVSVVQVLTHYAQEPSRPAYLSSPRFHQQIEHELTRRSPDDFRAWIRQQRATRTSAIRARVIATSRSVSSTPLRQQPGRALRFLIRFCVWTCRHSLRQPLAFWFKRAGRDPYELWCRIRGRDRGFSKVESIRRRTGDLLPLRADRTSLLAAARTWLDTTP